MNERGAKRLFLVGTVLSSALFIWLTVDTHRQAPALTNSDKLTSEVVEGKQVWHKHNCNDCHTILGFGGYYAPDLTRAYWRLGEAGIAQVIGHPEVAFEKSPRHMPQQNLSGEEIAKLVAFLEWTSNIDNNNWPPQDEKFGKGTPRTTTSEPMDGMKVFRNKGCGSCHRFAGTGSGIGPDLTHAGLRLSRAEMAQVIVDPRSVTPDGIMPPQKLTDQELEALLNLLVEAR